MEDIKPPQSQPVVIRDEHHASTKTLLAILGVLVVLVAAYLLLRDTSFLGANQGETEPQAELETASSVDPVALDSIPSSVPMDRAAVVESYRTAYADQSVEQYTATFEVSASPEDKWAEYESFLLSEGYRLVPESTSKPGGTLYGLKSNTGLLVTISTESGKTLVRLDYYVKS